jgi:hypothetical protein
MASVWVTIDSNGESGPEVNAYRSRAAAVRAIAAYERESAGGEYSEDISDEEVAEQWLEDWALLVEVTIQE